MSHVTPEDDAPASGQAGPGVAGRSTALATWVLYALILPTGGLTAVIGVIIAYATRSRSSGLVRTHVDNQIRLFWSGFIWAALFSVAWLISALLVAVYVGVILVFVVWAALLLLGIWFTARGVLGALSLTGGREP
ncbi:MAG: hypothetical protein EON85_09370 [Brevundimonas sp.]|nr:MAG: hypothetical protein EON85_09370 [Brevundimonas sp.]